MRIEFLADASDDRRPRHIPLDQIAMQAKKENELCSEAPFYTPGPLITDIEPLLYNSCS
jgi:thiamine biosynthesis protein ThiC